MALCSLLAVCYHTIVKPLTDEQRRFHANLSLYFFLPSIPLMFHGALQLTDKRFPSWFIVPPLLSTMYTHYRIFEVWRECPSAALDVAMVHWGPVWQRIVADMAIFEEGVTDGEFGHLVRNFWLAAILETISSMLMTRYIGRIAEGCVLTHERMF